MSFMSEYPDGRRTGRTTRQVDAMVQHLFVSGEVVVHDHDDWQPCELKRVLRVLCDRLTREHPGVQLEVDHRRCLIRIKRAMQ